MHDFHMAGHPLFNAGYLDPFAVERAYIKAKYQTLSIIDLIQRTERKSFFLV